MNDQRPAGPRLNKYHSPKRQLLAAQPGQAAPAWRAANIPTGPATGRGGPSSPKNASDSGSKILVTNLPVDVGVEEVEELFKRTVGPLKDQFLIYNSQANPKGMAVVTFFRATDAVLARKKYNGKLVDGRHRIKIEIVYDSDVPELNPATLSASKPQSLLSRLSPALPSKLVPQAGVAPAVNGASHASTTASKTRPLKVTQVTVAPKKRQKKGPKRINKKVDAATLDQEMDEYHASAVS